jgi:hypothetical protein
VLLEKAVGLFGKLRAGSERYRRRKRRDSSDVKFCVKCKRKLAVILEEPFFS